MQLVVIVIKQFWFIENFYSEFLAICDPCGFKDLGEGTLTQFIL